MEWRRLIRYYFFHVFLHALEYCSETINDKHFTDDHHHHRDNIKGPGRKGQLFPSQERKSVQNQEDVKMSSGDWKSKPKLQKIEQALNQLENPFDEMSLVQKKHIALFMCYRRLQVNCKNLARIVTLRGALKKNCFFINIINKKLRNFR